MFTLLFLLIRTTNVYCVYLVSEKMLDQFFISFVNTVIPKGGYRNILHKNETEALRGSITFLKSYRGDRETYGAGIWSQVCPPVKQYPWVSCAALPPPAFVSWLVDSSLSPLPARSPYLLSPLLGNFFFSCPWPSLFCLADSYLVFNLISLESFRRLFPL